MLFRAALLRHSAALAPRRPLHPRRPFSAAKNTGHKRALSKNQLKGDKSGASPANAKPPAAAAAKPPPAAAKEGGKPPVPPSSAGGGSAGKAAPSGGAPSGGAGGGGGMLFPLLLLGGAGVGGAYYTGMIPEEYLPDMLKGEKTPKKSAVKVEKQLKEAVEEVMEKQDAVVEAVEEKAAEAAAIVEEVAEGVPLVEAVEEAEEEVSLEHPEGGSRVDIGKIGAFYQSVNEGRAKQEEDEAREAAAMATAYNEAEETQTDPMSAVTAAANAMAELQSSGSLENSQTLAAAKAALRSDLDAEYFADLDKLSDSELRVRVVQLATEMSDRTKWEAVRLKEFLAMKEKEVGDKYLEILQKQRLEFESLLAQKMREQEDSITRQANAALAAKEESIQGLLKATSEAREKEVQDILTEETKRLADEMNLEYESKLQNELAAAKQSHATELEGHVATMTGLQQKLSNLESRLEVSRSYESGSRRAHRVSAAALALANKLETADGAAVELAALRGAAGEEGVIASAVGMIPSAANEGVPTLADLQASFDQAYKVGRQAAMVPEGRGGLEGQLMGMAFAKLSVPPSPDAVPASEDEGSVADGILSLARRSVQLGDLEGAVAQLDKLKGQTAYVVNDWKSKAMDRVSAERALKVIKLECALLNKDLCAEP
ncbi:hypothetical protein ACHAXT_013176 [Thalassiosira profunda]